MHVSCLKASSYQGTIVQRRCCTTWSFTTQHFLKSRTIFFHPSSSQNTQVLPSPAMPTTTLLDLPPELIIIVFKSFGEFSSATALVRTSHKFHSVWEDSPSTITNAVLPRAIEYFDQATERLEADDKLANNQASADATHPAIQRTKRLVANMMVARRVLRHY